MSETEKPGRNDPCPCGSEKKWKNCCGKKSLWILEHPAYKDDKTCQAVDEAEAKASFEAFFNGEKDAGRLPAEASFFDGFVYKDGTRVMWHYDHTAMSKLKSCYAATQVEAWEIFERWWTAEVTAGRLSGKMSDGKIYRATDPPPQAQRAATCPNKPTHKDSKGTLLCSEHAGTAEGILLDVGLADANAQAGFRCARPARIG